MREKAAVAQCFNRLGFGTTRIGALVALLLFLQSTSAAFASISGAESHLGASPAGVSCLDGHALAGSKERPAPQSPRHDPGQCCVSHCAALGSLVALISFSALEHSPQPEQVWTASALTEPRPAPRNPSGFARAPPARAA